MKLRPYQVNTRNELYYYIKTNRGKNPCLVLPTGAGKSLIIAQIAKDFFSKPKSGRLIMLTHVSELIQQNYDKVTSFIGKGDVGIYSSGLGQKDLTKKITFAGIQSIYKVKKTPEYKVILIDECHLINTKNEGTYRSFIGRFPDALVIGLTATPYRMNNGFIDEADTPIFHDRLYPTGTGIKDLIEDGYLSKLKSKVSTESYSFKGVSKQNGDFNKREVNDIINHFEAIEPVIKDIIERTKNHKHVLVFCAGVEHSENVSEAFKQHGERAYYVHGKMSKDNRKMAIDSFKAGLLKYLCNPNILTTGFDFPNIDCVVMLRPTASTALYMQIVGRGMRLKDHTDHCLILDYVGNIERHGSVINPNVKGKPPAKNIICPNCLEVNPADTPECLECGFELIKKEHREPREPREPKEKDESYALYNHDIMHEEKPLEMAVVSWDWKIYTSKKDGLRGVVCRINGADGNFENVFYPVENERAKWPMLKTIKNIEDSIKDDKQITYTSLMTTAIYKRDCTMFLNPTKYLRPPAFITYTKDKFVNIKEYKFD